MSSAWTGNKCQKAALDCQLLNPKRLESAATASLPLNSAVPLAAYEHIAVHRFSGLEDISSLSLGIQKYAKGLVLINSSDSWLQPEFLPTLSEDVEIPVVLVMNRPGLSLWKQMQSNECDVEVLIQQEAPSDQLPGFEETAAGFTVLEGEGLVKSSQQGWGDGRKRFGLNKKVKELVNDATGRPSVNEGNVVEICGLFDEYAKRVCDIA